MITRSDALRPSVTHPVVDRAGLITRPWADYFARMALAQSSDELQQLFQALADRVAQLEQGGSVKVVGRRSVTSSGTAIVYVSLVNDVETPGNTEYYGSDATGKRGFFPFADAIGVDAGELEKTVGPDGVVMLGLAPLEDAGGGELLKLVRDQYGRVAGTSAATTDDLDEGSTNFYFTTARAQAVIDAWISTLRFLTNAPDDDAALAAGVLTGQLYRNGSALMILVKEPPTYLDLLPVTPLCVWAIKKLVSTATLAIRVRRSSDNTEQDIGFSGDSLDVSALLAFVGAGSGYVTTIYDQTGGGKHFTQATTVSQPRIVNAGVYDGEMVFDGSDDIMSTATLTLGTQYAATYGRFRLPNGSDSIFLEYSANFFTTPYTFALYKNSSNSRMTIMQLAGEDTTNQFALTTGSKQVFSMLWDRQASPWSARMRAWENGVEKPATMIFDKSPSATFGDQPLFVGARSGGAYAGACGVESIALYRDDTLAIRGLIEASVGA